jgi:hypothetical protein
MQPRNRPSPRDVEAAGGLLTCMLAAAARAARNGVYLPPPGQPQPRRRRQPGSLRHIAEVIRTNRLSPGLSVDKDIVAAVLAGEHRYAVNADVVVAVAKACHLIARTPFPPAEEANLRAASRHLAHLLSRRSV